MRTRLLEASNFFYERRGRLGLSYGILIGAGIMYAHMRSLNHETELVITDEDARHMNEDDAVGVYHTKYGVIFTAMQKDPVETELVEVVVPEEGL